MTTDPHRRRFVRSLAAGGAALAGWPTRAATPGRVYFGFFGTVTSVPQYLKEIQRRYQPDLGLAPTLVPGNSGARALEAVRGAPADGSAVLLSPSGAMTLLPHLRKLPAIDPVSDFVAVASLSEFTLAVVVGPAVPTEVTSLKGYLDWVRDNPASSGYGVPGLGVTPHLAGIELAHAVDLPLKAVPYQGLAPMLKDVLAGGIPAAITSVGGARPVSDDPRLRLLAVTSEQRWPGLPEVPTLRELGVADSGFSESYGLFMSAGVPASKVEELNEAVRQAQASADVTAAVREGLQRITPMTAEQYAAALARERSRWEVVVRRGRITVNS